MVAQIRVARRAHYAAQPSLLQEGRDRGQRDGRRPRVATAIRLVGRATALSEKHVTGERSTHPGNASSIPNDARGTAPELADVIGHFRCVGRYVNAGPYGAGHIHDTYVAWFRGRSGAKHRYLLQRINDHVFRDVEGLMANIAAVTDHLRKKIAELGGDPERSAITLIPTRDGATYWQSQQMDYWRAFVFIEGAATYDVAESAHHVYEVAKAFGTFQKLLADFPAERLTETIPFFHHTARRYEAFQKAVAADVADRAHTARQEIAFVERRAADMTALLDLLAAGRVTLRVTHNDTKVNNVMISEVTSSAVCVIDLDTVMPGLAAYDFGDMVRSGASQSAEDEPDASKAGLDLSAYESIVRGYLDSAREFLTAEEVDSLPISARLMTLECGMRFLADYLSGDVYFKTRRPGHNLDRCRTQFRMVGDMEHRFSDLQRIVQQWR
jgi:Ser/Thr protein kinase RdoA (MazF antagonist)